MSHPFFVIPHRFLVQPLPQSPATLVGSPIVDDYLPITVDYSRPFIFFPRNQPVQCFFGQPMLAVHILTGVAPPAAAAPILLPPLLATHLMRPVNPALYLVPVSSLWVTIPAPRRNYVPPVLGPEPRVLGPPVRVLGPNTGNPETQRVVSVKFENREMPSHGHLYFYTSAAVQQLLEGKSYITLKIGGKNIIVTKYVPQSQRNRAMQDVPH